MSCWLQISSGRGPLECCRAVALLAPLLQRELVAAGLDVRVIEQVTGDAAGTLKSLLLSVTPEPSAKFLKRWVGTHQWRERSPYRRNHKRMNWFVGVTVIAADDTDDWSMRDVVLEPYKGSGAGGQHRNKNETAIRARHLPTATIAVANEERSRRMNERLAIWRLRQKIELQQSDRVASQQRVIWGQHNQLERGNAKLVFCGTQRLRIIKE